MPAGSGAGGVPPTGRVVLFGATGYTGALVARAMSRRGMRPVLAGRRRSALEELAAELGGLDTAVADAADPPSVRGLVDAGDVLVSTVGPFARWGEAALEAALDAGAHYLDSSGEPAFIRRVFERAGPRAERLGVLLLPAMAQDWVPGNLAGALAMRDAPEGATALRIGYFTKQSGLGGQSTGTRASSALVALDASFQFREGRVRTERVARRVASFDLGDGRRHPAFSIGTTEAFSLPRRYPQLRTVEVHLGWFGAASRGMQALSLAAAGVVRIPPLRSAAHRLAARATSSSGSGPDPEARARTGTRVAAEALSATSQLLARVRLEGASVYDFSGECLAWAAQSLADGHALGAGALGPVEAFGLELLEAGVAESGLARVDS